MPCRIQVAIARQLCLGSLCRCSGLIRARPTTKTSMSVVIIVRAIVTTGLLSGTTVLDSLCGRLTLERGDEIVRTWSKRLLDQVDVRLLVRGTENIDPQRT